MVSTDRSVQTVASSAESAERVDQRQYDLGDGPCFAAINTGALIAVQQTAGEQRWPDWARFAAEIGITAAVSAPLLADCSIGALNLYRLEPATGDVGDGAVAAAELLAAHATVLLAHFRAMQNLRGAIDTRNVIGQAQGMLMERYRLTAPAAFAVLRRYSNHCNSKVVVVAERLIATGSLPGTADRFGHRRTGAVTKS